MSAVELHTRRAAAHRPHRFGGLLALLFAGLVAFHPGAAQGLEAGGGVSTEQRGTVATSAGTATATMQGGASGSASVSGTGAQAQGQIGIAAQLKAASEKYTAGGDDLNVSGQLSGSVEFLIGAEASVGAYIDGEGIHIGAEGSAGAYVSAEISADFEAEVFGVSTQVHAYAEGSAGLMAEGEASVTIGFDGQISFVLGAGVVAGVGGSVGVEFSVDASELMAEFDLANLEQLAAWIAAFVQDPEAAMQALLVSAADAMTAKTLEQFAAYVEQLKRDAGDLWADLWGDEEKEALPSPPTHRLPDTADGGRRQEPPPPDATIQPVLPGREEITKHELPSGIVLPERIRLPEVPPLPNIQLP